MLISREYAETLAMDELVGVGNWYKENGVVVFDKTQYPTITDTTIATKTDEIYSRLQDEETKREEKITGREYNGYMIPFTSEDAVGLLQVSAAFELGIQNTNIEFSNGTKMPITKDEFPAFAAWFVEQRNSFFV